MVEISFVLIFLDLIDILFFFNTNFTMFCNYIATNVFFYVDLCGCVILNVNRINDETLHSDNLKNPRFLLLRITTFVIKLILYNY